MNGRSGPASVTYLNNAAHGFPTSPLAIETFCSVLSSVPTGARQSSASRVEEARARAAGLLDCSTDQVAFSPSATIGINQVIAGFLRAGDHCVVDNRSHNAVLRAVANQPGVSFDVAGLYDADDRARVEVLTRQLRPETRLVCLDHVSNVTGSIYDVGQVIRSVREQGPEVAVLVDASQSAGLLDLRDLGGADFVVFGAHKYLHGIPGAAILVRRRPLRPIFFGGTGTHSAIIRIEDLPGPPLEVGTDNEPAVCALVRCMEAAAAELEERRSRNEELTAYLWSRLSAFPELRPIGRPPGRDRIGVVAVLPELGDPQLEWVPFLASQGIVVRGGLHCAPTIHEELGVLDSGTLRVSVGHYTTREDIDQLVAAMADFLEALRVVGLPGRGVYRADRTP